MPAPTALASAGTIAGGTLPRPNATSARPRAPSPATTRIRPVVHAGVGLHQLDARVEPRHAQPGLGARVAPGRPRQRRAAGTITVAGVHDAERAELRRARTTPTTPCASCGLRAPAESARPSRRARRGRAPRGRRRRARRPAGSPGRPSSTSDTVRIAPTSTTGLSVVSTRSSRYAVSSIVSVPCVMTRPSMSGRSSQAAARRASRHICSGVTCGPGRREKSSTSIVRDRRRARGPARGCRRRRAPARRAPVAGSSFIEIVPPVKRMPIIGRGISATRARPGISARRRC